MTLIRQGSSLHMTCSDPKIEKVSDNLLLFMLADYSIESLVLSPSLGAVTVEVWPDKVIILIEARYLLTGRASIGYAMQLLNVCI